MRITTPPALDDAAAAAVRALADEIEQRDAAPPLSDQGRAQLGSNAVKHVLAYVGPRLAGYAQLDANSAEIVAKPGTVGPLLHQLGPDAQLVWSHGERSPLGPALESHGFRRARVLHQLRRGLADPIDEAPVPDGVTVRAFTLGADEAAWVRVNAAAFAGHPEQGRWTIEDLQAREAEPWFDPAGFFLALRSEDLIGFHWTKVHADGAGEVYVIGVDPAAQGSHLGSALLALGLTHLRERGCPSVLLYVDDDNAGAVRLYERSGFHRHDSDTQWRRAK
jgi:mycothiol synthase